MSENKKIDPVFVAILDSHLNAIAEEMGTAVMRTSMNPVFAEAGDFGVAILDSKLRLVVEKDYLAILASAVSSSIVNIAQAYEEDTFEGDIFIHNDPYAGNTHIGDVNIVKPVFHQGKIQFWAGVKGHLPDMGGPGFKVSCYGSTEYENGLILPACKLYEKGKLNRGVYDIIMRNNKLPEATWGDIMCEIGGVTIAEKRLQQLLDQYGDETFNNAIDEILNSSEKQMRYLIAQIPDGDYYGEKSVEYREPSLEIKRLTARVKLSKQGEEISIDLSDSDPQVNNCWNCSWAGTVGACQLILAYNLPGIARRNQGSMAPIKVFAREGTFTNPKFPASTLMTTTESPDCIMEAVVKALSQAIPAHVAAPHAKHAHYVYTVYNNRTNRTLRNVDFFMVCDPSGGTEGYDGWDMGGPSFQLGGAQFPDLEIYELLLPIHILRHEHEIDSAGDGKYRSGLGHVYKVQYLTDIVHGHLSGAGMEDYSVPQGLFGGHSPKPSTMEIQHSDGQKERIKVNLPFTFQSGDIFEFHNMGGAGFGNPFERDPEKVLADVKDEHISVSKAREIYGVVIDGDKLKIDIDATEIMRKQSKNK